MWRILLFIGIHVFACLSLSGFLFEDNKSSKRWVDDNGEITYRLSQWYQTIGCCFTTYVNFDRYSSIVTFVDFRTNYDNRSYAEWFYAKPDKLRMYGHYDFDFNGTETNNVRLKWLSICFNINYTEGTMELFLNGETLWPKVRKPMELPPDWEISPMIVRLGRYYFDDTPLIGKIVDFNMWDRLLTSEEMKKFTNCTNYEEINPIGNLINKDTSWNISGTLIKNLDLSTQEINCAPRTLLLPIRYRTIEDAMGICEALGETGDFLKPFENYDEWVKFRNIYMKNPAIEKYCDHGGRYMLWLPYQGWADITDEAVNVTYYKSSQQLLMNDAWRKNNPKNTNRPYCVIARFGYEANQSWVDNDCDLWESVYGWDRAPCSACTLSNAVSKNIEFKLRGLCDRTGFDTSFMVTNEEETGLLSYIGEKHTIIKYDQTLYQWNMTVANNPDIQGTCYSDVSSLLIGKHSWHVSGDYACSSKPYDLVLALSSCDQTQFTCSGGVCIDMLSRCDNINDCADKSDEADCSRVSIEPTYQKFIVPPPLPYLERSTINVSLELSKIMDISEVGGYFQVQFVLTMKWFETRLRFKNLKDDISLNSFLPSEVEKVWVPELTFSNTEEKPTTIVDDRASISVKKIGGYKLSETYENENIQYFAGKENPLHLSRFYNQRFLCDYQLGWYPFDIQHCYLRMSIKTSYSPFTKLIVEFYEYLGNRLLTQYEVKDFLMDIRNTDGGIQEVFVTITLGRQLLGVVLNIIIPTVVLNIISYSTNFYKEDYFETVIAINLTTMLVIVTLFVSVSDSLPATSYIKMIDIWLLFNLIIPFALIMIHTFMDYLRENIKDAEEANKSFQNSDENLSRRKRYTSGDTNSMKMKQKFDSNSSSSNSIEEHSKWGNMETNKIPTVKNEKYLRISRHIALIFIPVFSLIFVILFFGIGLIQTSLNK